jgi:hypothetical protein
MYPHEKVEIHLGPLGKGIHARFPIRAGEKILEFEGPRLTHAEVLDLGEDEAYSIQMGPDEYIDTRPPGRFTNHSCEPNAGISSDRMLVAIRDIAAGAEVRFDYSTTMSENHWTMVCRCGEPRCRRVIRDFHFLPPSLQAHYIRLGLVQRFIEKEWRNRAQLLDTQDRRRYLSVRRAGA